MSGPAARPATSADAQSSALLLYIGVIAAASLAISVPLSPTGLNDDPRTTLALAALAALAGSRPVRISALRTEVTATHPFIFCGLSVVGPDAACLAAVAGVFSAAAFHKTRVAPFRLIFNLGAVLLSTACAGWIFQWTGGLAGTGLVPTLVPLTAATAVFFACNTGLVAGAIALERRQSFLATWRHSTQWTTLSFVAGLTLALGLMLYLDVMGTLGLMLGIPPCWLLAAFYRSYKERMDEQQSRMAEIERLNAELEDRVEERTRDLEQALRQVEELQSLKLALTQSLVHDLKNPLTAIVGNLDLLDLHAEERTHRVIERCRSGAGRLLGMIMDLLDVASIEEGRFVVREDRLELNGLVESTAEEARATARQRGVRIETTTPAETCVVRGDESVLRRVLDNLLANALQHTPSDSTVRIALSHSVDEVEIGISDQGPGIPEQYRAKVFEKYAQVELRNQGVCLNRGLGLTFCQMAVKAHQGSIRVEAAPGGGALFRITLPGCVRAGDRAIDPIVTVLEGLDGAAPTPQLPAGDPWSRPN